MEINKFNSIDLDKISEAVCSILNKFNLLFLSKLSDEEKRIFFDPFINEVPKLVMEKAGTTTKYREFRQYVTNSISRLTRESFFAYATVLKNNDRPDLLTNFLICTKELLPQSCQDILVNKFFTPAVNVNQEYNKKHKITFFTTPSEDNSKVTLSNISMQSSLEKK